MIYEKDNPKQVARWLRRCVEDSKEPDRCYACPYGQFASLDGERNCIDELHTAAAELIERLCGIRRER